MGTRKTFLGVLLDVLLLGALVEELLRARVRTRFLPVRNLRARLEADPSERPAPPVSTSPTRSRIQRAVLRRVRRDVPRISRRVPWKARCLEQALCAGDILRWFGVQSRLRLGVAKEGEDLAAHAWLEVDGKVVLGRLPDRAFQPFDDSSR